MTIAIGSPCINRTSQQGIQNTSLDFQNPANASGTIDTIEAWAVTNIPNLQVGTFFLVSGTTYQCRDSVALGLVTAGAKRTFSGLNLKVVAGDIIGVYCASGALEGSSTGQVAIGNTAGEKIDPGDSAAFTIFANYGWSCRGTGYQISTLAASGILAFEAIGNGAVAEPGTISQYGFDWGTAHGVYTAGSVVVSGTPPASFSAGMTGLEAATVYYYRAKVNHAVYGWIYGDEQIFQTGHDDTRATYENYLSDNNYQAIYGNNWAAQTFTPAISHQLTSVKVKLYKNTTGSGDGLNLVTVAIRATDGANKPVAPDLCSATMPMGIVPLAATVLEFGFGDGITVTAAVRYAVVIRRAGGTAANYLAWRLNAPGGYANGQFGSSTDGGTAWTLSASDFYFMEYGDSGVETHPVTNKRSFQVTGNGYLNDATSVTQIGFEWGTTIGGPYPYSVVEAPDYVGTGNYGMELTGLSALTGYSYRAKIYHTTYGWLYGNEVQFVTPQPWPIVRTDPPSGASFSAANIDAVGEITYVGAENADKRGFVYDLVSVPVDPGDVAPEASGYAEDETEDGDYGVGSFTLQLRNLNAGKTYYIRAYAHNVYGHSYGSEIRALVSDTVCLLYPNSDASKGIRFDSSPGGLYPHPFGGTVPHYQLVASKDTGWIYPSWTRWGIISPCNMVYEYNYYNDNYYSDIYGLFNPIIRTEGCIKVKWKARLFRLYYPYGKYKRLLYTHGTQYDGAAGDIALTTNGMDVCELFYVNLYSGVNWTVAELDDLQGGVTLGQSGGFGMAICDWVEVVAIWHNAEAQADDSSLYNGVSARLNGHVVEDEGEECQVRFEWGPDTGYGQTTAWQTRARGDVFYADISGLDPAILYHCRAVIVTACGETFYGADMTVDYDYGKLLLEQAYSVAGEEQSIFTVSPEWTDITEYLMKLHTKRGRLHELDRVEAGTAVFTLDNASGNFWRDNTAGAFYPDIKPLTLTRLRYRYQGVYYYLWYGVSESYDPGWVVGGEGGFTPAMTLGCVDLFKSFARYKLTGANPAMTADAAAGQKNVVIASVVKLIVGQSIKVYDDDNSEVNCVAAVDSATMTVTMTTNLAHTYRSSHGGSLKKFPSVLSGTRMNDCLLELGWPLVLSHVDAGQLMVTEHTPEATGTNIMEHMYAVAEAEDGLVFMAANGWFIFQDSLARTRAVTVPPYQSTAALTTPQAVFRDDGADSRYVHPKLRDDDTFIYNEADIAGPGITEQIVTDGTLQLRQGPRALTRKDSQLADSDDAFNQAFVYVEKFHDSSLRCDSLLLKPQAAAANLYPLALGFEISTRLSFLLNSARNPAMLSKAYHVEGVEHDWDGMTGLWTTTWPLWNVAKVYACKSTHDGYCKNVLPPPATYEDTHQDPVSAYVFNDDIGATLVGQHPYIPFFSNYQIYRAVVEFDTILVDPSWTITKALVAVKLTPQSTLFSKREFELHVTKATLVAGFPITEDTYGDLLPMNVSLGNVVVQAESFEPYIAFIELNATGIAEINKGGLTRLAFRSGYDMTMTEPPDDEGEWVLVDSKAGGFKPRLFVCLE